MKEQASASHRAQLSCIRLLITAPLIGIFLTACDSNSSSGSGTEAATDDIDLTLADADMQTTPTMTEDPTLDSMEAMPGGTTVSTGDANAAVIGGEDRVGLVIESTQRCAAVDDSIELVISRELLEDETPSENGELPNVTGFVEFTQVYGDSLDIISRSDDSAVFAMGQQDIVGLIANIDNGSVTAFLAAYDTAAPDNFIMRKPVSDSCLYAFKSGDYCAAGRATVGSIAFSRNGLSMSAVGCELENPDAMTVIELPAVN